MAVTAISPNAVSASMVGVTAVQDTATVLNGPDILRTRRTRTVST
jgi:hypothetical protein